MRLCKCPGKLLVLAKEEMFALSVATQKMRITATRQKSCEKQNVRVKEVCIRQISQHLAKVRLASARLAIEEQTRGNGNTRRRDT